MLKVLKWTALVVVVLYAALVVYRMFVLNEEDKTEAQVEKIHATKLTLGDVLGRNLPPSYAEASKGKPDYDATVEGVDENKNGIRDDVELAIFKEYPDSTKTRAVLLQYALALQMEVIQPLVNKGTVVAVAQVGDKASACIGESVPRTDLQKFIDTTQKYANFIDATQWNTDGRKKAKKDFYNGNLESYSSLDDTCDLDLSIFSN